MYRLYELYGHARSLFVLGGDETAVRLHEGLEWPNAKEHTQLILHFGHLPMVSVDAGNGQLARVME